MEKDGDISEEGGGGTQVYTHTHNLGGGILAAGVNSSISFTGPDSPANHQGSLKQNRPDKLFPFKALLYKSFLYITYTHV